MNNDLIIVKKILGELPEIDDIYRKAAKDIYGDKYGHQDLIPYFLYKLYSKNEMEIVSALPGTPMSVSEKLNLDIKKCEEILNDLFHKGKIEAGKKFDVNSIGTYLPPYSRGNLYDHLTAAYLRDDKDLNEEKELFLLFKEWLEPESDEIKYIDNSAKGTRIVPKWNSIKDVPGVMPCENMKEIFFENFNNHKLGWIECICRNHVNLRTFGSSKVPESRGKSELLEHSNVDGHCLWYGSTYDYMKKVFGLYTPKNYEEALKEFNDLENAKVCYQFFNNNLPSRCCCCHEDGCLDKDIPHRVAMNAPSRFRPEVSEDKCVGCKICTTRCMFGAIVYNKDGKCIINADNCMGCGNCVIKCPTKALKMKIVRDIDFIPKII